MAELLSEINSKESLLEAKNNESCLLSTLSNNEQDKKCGEIFVRTNTQFWFLCSFCDERFHTFVSFTDHIQDIHFTEIKQSPSQEDDKFSDFQPTEDFKMNDQIDSNDGNNDEGCAKYEWVSVEEEEVTKPDGSNIDSMVPETIDSTNADCCSQLSLSENEPLICQKIDDLLPIAKNLPKKRNRKKKVHQCSLCEHIARNLGSLEIHMREVHGSGSRYQCEECGKCFTNGNNLRAHLIIHAGTRPYKCEFCNAGFSHSNSLKSHRYLHTGNRPYKCNHCEKSFVTTSSLKNHMREHTGEQPYQCFICERRFASQSAFKRHTISHKGERSFACTVCDKAFVHKESLTRHMVCHSNVKNFKCEVCDKRFAHKKNLVQHKKLHDGVKTYICKVCDKDFAQYAGLYSHMKYHSKD